MRPINDGFDIVAVRVEHKRRVISAMIGARSGSAVVAPAGGKRRIVWFEDSRSLQARLELALSRGLAGVSLWPRDRLYRPGLLTLQSCCTGEKLV